MLMEKLAKSRCMGWCGNLTTSGCICITDAVLGFETPCQIHKKPCGCKPSKKHTPNSIQF